MLIDRFHRVHDYLRISLTDVCNLRCTYCMPVDNEFLPHSALMQTNELLALTQMLVDLGVKKIRLTGGEPLARKDVKEIIEAMSAMPIELTLTTNGVLLHQYIDTLQKAGIKQVNVSLDTLQADKFKAITHRDLFAQVWRNIELLLQHKIEVKLNCVVMRGVNEEELISFAALTAQYPIHVRFIEFMPFTGNRWQQASVMSYQEMIETLSAQLNLIKLPDDMHDTTKKYKVPSWPGTIAVISTLTAPFCAGCNRIRLTADGKLKNCLFAADETDILQAYRSDLDVVDLIRQNLLTKHAQTGGQLWSDYRHIHAEDVINRSMIQIGG